MATVIKSLATVEKIIPHGRSTYTLLLRSERKLPRFRPGQFTHLSLELFDPAGHWPESRVFSIASSPAERTLIKLTYTVQGDYTARMEQELSEGGQVSLKMPYGDFTFTEEFPGEVVLIAGGTGFTPFGAFLEDQLARGEYQPLRIFYGAANPDLLMYAGLVREWAGNAPDGRYLLFAEEGVEAAEDIQPGRLRMDCMLEQVDSVSSATFFLSGPKPMIDAFSDQLAARGVRDEQIRIDKWE